MKKIELKNLVKSFENNTVFKNVSLDILEGETMVILGRSGCGKSVMLKHIVGLYKPDDGEVFVDGMNITYLSEHKLYPIRKKFGFLFQGAALLDSLTVEENVGLGLSEIMKINPREIKKIAAEKLAMVGMAGTERKMPSELSGGMRKRVGLARAISMNPQIVLYDEPTTGLDPIMAESINELIVKLKRELKITSVVVTHDMKSAATVGDRAAMLHNGEIIFTGTFDELYSSKDKFIKKFVEGKAEEENTI